MRDKLAKAIKEKQYTSKPVTKLNDLYNPKTYNIIEEVYFNREFYYLTKEGDVLKAKPLLPLPNHPMVDYKKFNDKTLFDVQPLPLPIGLEKIIDDLK